MIDDMLTNAAKMGLKVVRMWGFMDGQSPNGVSMQPSLGAYDPSGLERIDHTIQEAHRLGLRLVIVLVNNWDDFGGMNQYVKWTGGGSHDDFYTRPSIQKAYKNFVKHVILHKNQYTGVTYRDDPTIMTWELANEPRVQSDPTGDTLVNWVRQMSHYIRQLDPNHLIAVGDEGFFNDPTHAGWEYNGSQGVDWNRLLAIPDVSYGTFHLYPEDWNETSAWGNQWIADHLNAARRGGKPVVMEEFGYKDPSAQLSVYRSWLNTFVKGGGDGEQFWMLSGIQDDGTLYPNYDGCAVYYPSKTAQLLSSYAKMFNGKSGKPLKQSK